VVDLSAMMRQAVHRHRAGAERSGCRLQPSIEGEVSGILDELAIEQIADNLLSNAVKYGAGEPIEVSLVGDGAKARLTVRDHGIGISEEDQARILLDPIMPDPQIASRDTEELGDGEREQ
jgi:two-component system, OmpR family, sensor kinase